MPDTSPDDGSGPNIGGTGSGYTSRPIPDPTILTTQALYREVSGLQALIEQRMRSLEDKIGEHAGSAQRQIELIVHARDNDLTAIRDTVAADVKGLTSLREAQIQLVADQIEHLGDTVDERFRSIATQFLERDTRSERESRDNKVAVDAAFAAQKEAAAKQEETFSKGIDKSEAATQETINKLTELFRTTNQGLSDKVDDLKQRLVDSERNTLLRIAEVQQIASQFAQQKTGSSETRTIGFALVAALAAIIGIAGVVVAIIR